MVLFYIKSTLKISGKAQKINIKMQMQEGKEIKEERKKSRKKVGYLKEEARGEIIFARKFSGNIYFS